MTRETGIASTRLIVGMEMHVELATRSKMFSRSANVAHEDHFDAPPNTLVDPVVLALPGTLPVMNKAAVEMAVMVGLALRCESARFSKWDRKNYFYPDLPKGYQISQYDLPLCFDGEIDIPIEENEHGETSKRIGIIRAHLEEDAGKLGHELPGGGAYAGSLVDYNRAGTPLLEIVSYPDMNSSAQAETFGRAVRSICRFLGVSQCIMQRGQMRFEPNINVMIVTEDGHEYFTPIVEVKNLNSFRSLRRAIEHEHERQVEAWQSDRRTMGPGTKTTRGWDDDRGVTFAQREKEEAHDYRYFPEPDLVPVELSDDQIAAIAARVPELPMDKQQRYRDEYGLTEKEAQFLTDDADVAHFYEQCIDAVHEASGSSVPTLHAGHASAKWLINTAARLAHERGCAIDELGIQPSQIAQIIVLRDNDEVGSSAAEQLFELLCETDDDARAVAQQHNLLQVRDTQQIDEWVAEAIESDPDAAEQYAAGKDAALGRLTGLVMKISKGKADAKRAQERLRAQLRDE